ncbi:uncharacterized protein LOC117174981 isoform X2 [Belonocnema kinseyi]|uniref:uncharacterized protein LOC117174981 isoform X2 n=1 Tax=Belonocnema kinseyi TaxID=2817044 RepID=UPI00143D0B99|nr:uncharacterized protein LOC117174981 isoform X2 [Belonocnema kinseyi]
MMEVISTRRYEARPPASAHPEILVDPEKSVATVKEEEWETRKKKEITTTRQIETRVKRQVVLEDGEVVVDSGPLVTTNTTEDVEQQEHTTQERRTTGDEPQEVEWPAGGKGGGIVQKELNETVVRSREEIEELLETEHRQQFGDISDETYLQAIRSNKGDLRIALAESSKQLAPQTGPRVVQHTTRSSKVVDTEKTLERSELKANGQIVTEKKKTIEHEEIKDDELPEDGKIGNGDSASETRKECSQRFLKTRDEDIVDYVSGGERIAREMRYVSETTEGERIGDWPPPPTTMRTHRLQKQADATPASRKDALTKKPLDLEEEDEARKFETSKWLESHFGSESRSSHGSIDEDPPIQTGTNTSFINVTMKSCTPRDREFQNTNSSRPQPRRTSGRDSTSPVGYFQGISEWSERYQGTDKPSNHARTSSPAHYVNDTSRDNGYIPENSRNHVESSYSRTFESKKHQERHEPPEHQRNGAPSPPLRRRVREQMRSEEKNSFSESPAGRTSSPVHVVQRTWESRSKDVQNQKSEREIRKSSEVKAKPIFTPRSRSISPILRMSSPTRKEKKIDEKIVEPESPRTPKSGQSKYKIGESFRKLVGKLRSASTERKNKRSGSSTSQLTQTDDSPTYLQYNTVDRNIPLVTDYSSEDKPPERPPRSPRNSTPVSQNIKTTKLNDYNSQEQWHRNDSGPPVQRYYLGEDPFGGSIYGREKGYENSKPHGRHRSSGKSGVEKEYSVESSSLGRFSKSTSRLANEYEKEEHFRSTQTLPRKLHTSSQSRQRRQTSGNHLNESRLGNHLNESRLNQINESITGNHFSESRIGNNHSNESRIGNNHSTESRNGNNHSTETRIGRTSSKPNQPHRYGSMINISIKNNVGHPKLVQSPLQGPTKPDRTYKSSLSRSKSFNVEASRNGNDRYSPSTHYKSNSQLNRLDETPPLKSPGILASISRSNRDLFKNGKHEH